MRLSKNKNLVAGCACGVLCALLVGLYAASVENDARAAEAEALARYGGDQVQAIVARHDIAAGEVITENDIEERTWVAALLPGEAVTVKADAIGKQVGSTILTGEVISSARFGSSTSAIDVPDGFYALSVPARAVQAVGGALAPGSAVDVYAIGSSSTTRIATSVLVLATSASQDASINADAWVTLAVEPARVQEVIQAAESQTLYFALPSKGGTEAASVQEGTDAGTGKTKAADGGSVKGGDEDAGHGSDLR